MNQGAWLSLEQRGERGIQTSYAIRFHYRLRAEEVSVARVGCFDVTPHEPELLTWSFVAGLYRIAERWLVRVAQSETRHTIRDGERLSRQRTEVRIYRRTRDGSWKQMQASDQLDGQTWFDLYHELTVTEPLHLVEGPEGRAVISEPAPEIRG